MERDSAQGPLFISIGHTENGPRNAKKQRGRHLNVIENNPQESFIPLLVGYRELSAE
jgi:hypothetical protein